MRCLQCFYRGALTTNSVRCPFKPAMSPAILQFVSSDVSLEFVAMRFSESSCYSPNDLTGDCVTIWLCLRYGMMLCDRHWADLVDFREQSHQKEANRANLCLIFIVHYFSKVHLPIYFCRCNFSTILLTSFCDILSRICYKGSRNFFYMDDLFAVVFSFGQMN